MNSTIIICFILFLVFFTLEKLSPARKLNNVKTWYKRVVFINIIQVLIIVLAGQTWDKFFMSSSLLKISHHLAPIYAALVGYLVITFIFYWWHRARHEFNIFWLTCHQLHHSPERLETITSFYKHPLEIVMNSIFISSISYGFLGLDTQAAAITLILTAFGEYFYHANIRTPYWLGFLIQRPEMHRVHHERGSHHYNYSDIPLWDVLFGTFKNPKKDIVKCGFENNLEQDFVKMIRFKDVFNKSFIKVELKFLLVIALGLTQMTGYLIDKDKIRGLGTLSVSSPLPIVFSTVNKLETFSQEFLIEVTSTDGRVISKKLDSKNYNQIKAPYNLRNVYGFSLAYGPAVIDDKMLYARNQILDFAFCSSKSSMAAIFPEVNKTEKWKLNVFSRALNDKQTLELEGICNQ
jgi:sterol desaturase/sphingolipid hydroxylase (fatty acid hydroxylase superfamily)